MISYRGIWKGKLGMDDRVKRFLKVCVVVLNILLLVSGGSLILCSNQNNITLHNIPLYTSEGEFKEGEQNFFHTEYPESYYYFVGKTGFMESGIYDITVDYDTYAYHDFYTVSCDCEGDGSHYPAVYAEPHALDSLSNSLTFRVWVNSRLENLNIKIKCGTKGGEIFDLSEGSAFYVDKIQISRNYRLTVLYKGMKLLTLLLLIDGLLFIFWNRRQILDKVRDNVYVVIGLACIFMVSSISVIGNFSVGHHDVPFHYSRIIGLAEGMANGSFPVKIQPGWLWGYGYASSVCYGDILLYFPAMLYMLGVPIIHAYKIYILLINAGTLTISYYCYKKISGNEYVGVTCAALYCLSITRLLNIYLRTAVGEYSAFMFLPLVLFGVWKIYTQQSKFFKDGGLFLCLGMTGVIQTHVISTEMSCIFIAIAVLLMIPKMSKQVFMALVKSVLATLCLNLGFLLPLLDYATDTLRVFAERKSYGIQQAGLSLYELFSFSSEAIGEWKDSFEGLSGRIPESLGIAMLIVLLCTVIAVFHGHVWEPAARREFLLSAALSGIAIWMTTYYFPYNRLAAVPGVKNVFASVQFPWRFLSIAIPLLVYMTCHVMVRIGRVFGKQKLQCMLLVICLAAAIQALYCVDMLNRSEDMSQVYYDYRDMRNNSWIASMGEYLLTGTDTSQAGLERDVVGENVQISTPERKGTQMQVACQAQENAKIVFPLFAYKYFQCFDIETGEEFLIIRGENNRIEVQLPNYYQGTIKVCFVEPWYWRMAELVSLFTLVWLIVYVFRKRRHSEAFYAE